MEYKLPHINGYDRQEWDWPFLKFHLKRDDLFTTLHDRFNMHQLPLQDPMAFHGDVCEAIDRSRTLDEFYSQMAERRAQRVKEMNEAFSEICRLIASGPWVLACPLCYDPETGDVKTPPGTLNDSMPQKWALFNYFSRSLSFDTLIRFFDGFVRDRRKKVEDRRRSADKALERFRQEAAARHAAAIAKLDKTRTAPRTGNDEAHSRLEAPSDASFPEDASSDELRPSSSQRRHGTAPRSSTTASPTSRKRKSDQDARQSQRKKRRATGESHEDDDDAVWLAAVHDVWETQEPLPTPRQAAKRDRMDDDPDEHRNKRSRSQSLDSMEDDDEPLHHRGSPNEQQSSRPQRPPSSKRKANGHAHISIDPQKAFYLPSEDGSEDEDEDAHDSIMDPQKAFYLPSAGSSEDATSKGDSLSTLDPTSTLDHMVTQWPMFPQGPMSSQASSVASYHTCPEAAEEEEEEEPADLRHLAGTQISSQEEPEGHEANDTTNEAADARKQKKKRSRALHRQRVDNRRSSHSSEESQSSSSQRTPRQKKHQERETSVPVEQLLQSRRSSRRTAGQTLFFLADDATACVASGKRNI
ncbi:hypothetical protein A9Z42_0003180 [Trichoderma parareesei]|uniref:Uncharacterized protein n=1 Tax=Trichoderma parareesei TaxID=858221 RepID=A0A2H2ZPC9_TRIPA|nr:hypothetical protein A9Z42_0003180 [Trichoderma parareesei]